MITITQEQNQVTLFYREGASDKVYQCSIEPQGNEFHVHFAFGRRGSTLNTGRKTTAPVSIEQAQNIINKLVREKKAKGYTEGENGIPYLHSPSAGKITGITCQLLNAIEEEQLESLILDPDYWAQEKYDGKRLLLHKVGTIVRGINRRGLERGVPLSLVTAAYTIPGDSLADGEAVGDLFFAFDLLEQDGRDLRSEPYRYRLLTLTNLLASAEQSHIYLVATASYLQEKRQLLYRLRQGQKEGVVFKHAEAAWTPGRPASGGPQLKHKFYSTLSAVVQKVNRQRSVDLQLWDGRQWKTAGKVTIPPNHDIPLVQSVIDARYLYAFPESGSLYQPLYLGVRNDVDPLECTTAQLKFKAPVSPEEEEREAAAAV